MKDTLQITKTDPREQDLFEAYKTIKKYRENLGVLCSNDLILRPYDVLLIHQEMKRMDEWIKLKEHIIKIQIEIV